MGFVLSPGGTGSGAAAVVQHARPNDARTSGRVDESPAGYAARPAFNRSARTGPAAAFAVTSHAGPLESSARRNVSVATDGGFGSDRTRARGGDRHSGRRERRTGQIAHTLGTAKHAARLRAVRSSARK